MAKRHKLWAKRERERLLQILGSKCKQCETTKNLTFDCISPRGDYHHRGSTDQRMCFYRKEHKKGNIQVLCAKCNAKKQAREEDQQPF